jgi:hypothetical protein
MSIKRLIGPLLLVLLAACAQVGEKTVAPAPPPAPVLIETEAIKVLYTHISDDRAAKLLTDADEGLIEVENYLGRTPPLPIVIRDVDGNEDSFSVTYATTTNGVRRYEIHIPDGRLGPKGRDTTLIHELTHAVAGEPYGDNLLLAEGLAVHVHGVLSPDTESQSYAQFPIHQIAKAVIKKDAEEFSVSSLYQKRSVFRSLDKTDLKTTIGRSYAYVVSGSFVKFLIDRYGVKKFMRVYNNGEFFITYGRDLTELEHDWRRYLMQY